MKIHLFFFMIGSERLYTRINNYSLFPVQPTQLEESGWVGQTGMK